MTHLRGEQSEAWNLLARAASLTSWHSSSRFHSSRSNRADGREWSPFLSTTRARTQVLLSQFIGNTSASLPKVPKYNSMHALPRDSNACNLPAYPSSYEYYYTGPLCNEDPGSKGDATPSTACKQERLSQLYRRQPKGTASSSQHHTATLSCRLPCVVSLGVLTWACTHRI